MSFQPIFEDENDDISVGGMDVSDIEDEVQNGPVAHPQQPSMSPHSKTQQAARPRPPPRGQPQNMVMPSPPPSYNMANEVFINKRSNNNDT